MNILLIQLKRIGDLILTTPAIAAIRHQFPDARINLIISRGCMPLIPAVPHVDHAYVMQRNPADIGTFFHVARSKFDVCVDFTRNNRSAFLTCLSRADKRIGSHRIKRRAPFRQKAYNEFVPGRMRDQHMVDYNLSLLEPLGIRDVSPPVRLILPAESCHDSVEILRKAKIQQPFVIFHPGSARIEKFWQPDRWAEVITTAMDRWHVTPVLTGGTSTQEKEHIAEIESKLPRPTGGSGPNVIDLSGKIDLMTVAALIAQARLLVTVDSAPMHLAAATNTPQVVLFGPTNPFHWRPRQDSALILQGDSPEPIQDFVARQERLPMKLISTQAVIDAMDFQLSMPAAKVYDRD
ncbi:MAG TPA: putative lipopolysaccharide heptosyltransferase III [Chthoniobacterales bacterium]